MCRMCYKRLPQNNARVAQRYVRVCDKINWTWDVSYWRVMMTKIHIVFTLFSEYSEFFLLAPLNIKLGVGYRDVLLDSFAQMELYTAHCIGARFLQSFRNLPVYSLAIGEKILMSTERALAVVAFSKTNNILINASKNNYVYVILGNIIELISTSF